VWVLVLGFFTFFYSCVSWVLHGITGRLVGLGGKVGCADEEFEDDEDGILG